MSRDLPTFGDVAAAAECLAGHAVRTPLIVSPALDAATGARVLLKPETLQRVGAFKFRGAFNRISRVDREQFPGGVVACSSGNHAQGVAHAATLLGHASAIVMPSDAPRLKIERTRAFGADVVLYDRVNEDREAIARDLEKKRQADFVHPFDDAAVIAGQGTAGLELAEDAKALGVVLDVVVVPCSTTTRGWLSEVDLGDVGDGGLGVAQAHLPTTISVDRIVESTGPNVGPVALRQIRELIADILGL